MDPMPGQGSTAPRKTPVEAPTPDSKPAPRPELSDDHRSKYEALLGRVKGFAEVGCAKERHKSGPLTELERAWLTRECLLRYLRATKWSVDESAKCLLSTLAWRREYGLEDFTADYISPEQETGKQMIFGFDRHGRPCQYLSPARQNTESSPRQVQHLFYMMERVIDVMPPGVETLDLLVNFRPAKDRQNTSVPVKTAKEVMSILQNHYPERLGKALIINGTAAEQPSPLLRARRAPRLTSDAVPWLFSGFFRVIQPFIDPVTREKLKFNEDMTKYVPPEQLWSADWGGDMDFEYDHGVYWPALHDMCRQRRQRRAARWAAAGKEIGESEEYLAGGTAVSVTGFRYDESAAGSDMDAVEKKLAATQLDGEAAGHKSEAREAVVAVGAA